MVEKVKFLKKSVLVVGIILAVIVVVSALVYIKIACVYSTVELIDKSESKTNGYVYFYSDTMEYYIYLPEGNSEKLTGKVKNNNRIIVKVDSGDHEYVIRYITREYFRKHPAEMVERKLRIKVTVHENQVTPVDLYGDVQDRQLKVECRIDEPITIEEWQRQADAWAKYSQETIREVELMKPECPWDCKKVPRLTK